MNPTVCAVMLANGRAPMVQRAIRCFREQTYPDKLLTVLDTTPNARAWDGEEGENEVYLWSPTDSGTIGTLRNTANREAIALNRWSGRTEYPEIFCHWDSDDWSHPRRIEEQVALLQASGKQCVGYRDMLFWRECSMCHGGRDNTLPNCPGCGLKYDPNRPTPVGEAWIYSNNDPRYCLGTSLCYWRSAWEARPFADAPKPGGSGEDKLWLDGIDSLGVTSIYMATPIDGTDTPRMVASMIASIHGGNTSTQYADLGRVESNNWRRAPEWADYCRKAMQL